MWGFRKGEEGSIRGVDIILSEWELELAFFFFFLFLLLPFEIEYRYSLSLFTCRLFVGLFISRFGYCWNQKWMVLCH